MFVEEKDLRRRFDAYDDEVLLRILTVERAQYRGEALAAVEAVLTRRGVPAPTFFPEPSPAAVAAPAAQGQAATPTSPYQFIDFCFDAVLLSLVCWAAVKLWAWTDVPSSSIVGQVAFGVLLGQLLVSAAALRQKWRAKQWS